MKNRLFFFFSLCVMALFISCDKDDDPSLEEYMIGDWDVDVVNIEGLAAAPTNMAFEFEDDGEFDLTFVFNGTRVDMRGEWEVDEESSELELDYDIQDIFFVGIGGFFLNKDIAREEYDLERDGDDDVDLDATVEGLDIELRLERD
jgi:hypothetical protein